MQRRSTKNILATIYMITLGVLSTVSQPMPELGIEPVFAEPIPNITVSAGRDVSLPCVVDNLGTYRVAWIHTDRYTLLTLQNRVITRNARYKVTHNGHRTWWLHIADVQERDKGEYMCQINTSPMKSQVGFIEVVVPPQIDEELTSSDTEVREGTDVTLRCFAKGSPEPEILWRREDGQIITLAKDKVTSYKGTYLNITKASRLHMGAYLCIAANGVLPSVSKRIVLSVNFAPMIWIPNQLVGAPINTDVALDCNLESHPKSVTYWMREGSVMILSNTKYESSLLPLGLYKIQLRLIIRNLQGDDFGSYLCVAKNSLGETEGTIRLYEIPPPMPPSTTQKPEPAQVKSEKLRNGFTQNALTKAEERETPSYAPVDVNTDVTANDDHSPTLKESLERNDKAVTGSNGIKLNSGCFIRKLFTFLIIETFTKFLL